MMRTAMLGRLAQFSPLTTVRSPRHFVRTISKKFKHGDSITFNVAVPPFGNLNVVECNTTDDLREFVKVYEGILSTINIDGVPVIIPSSQYSNLSPSIRYEIVSPFFDSTKDKQHHRQILDNAFEQKSHEAMVRYLGDHKLSFRELDRVIKVAGETVVEWDGVFELKDGRVWFLECKHCVTTDVVLAQPYRLEKSMMTLDKPASTGKIFLAGRYWKTTNAGDPKKEAQKLDFGILFENAGGLTALYKGAS